MDFNLTDEQRKLVAIAREVSKPFAARSLGYDHDAAFPKKNFQELKDAGLLKMTVPKQYGGHGLWQDKNYLAFYLVLEEIARQCSSTAQLLQVHSHGVGIVARAGTEQQLMRYMPAVAEGGSLFASCGSEASVRKGGAEGFDAVLKRKAGGYSLTGFKGLQGLFPEFGLVGVLLGFEQTYFVFFSAGFELEVFVLKFEPFAVELDLVELQVFKILPRNQEFDLTL